MCNTGGYPAAHPNTENFPPPPVLCAFADATLAHLPIALSRQLIDFGQHPGQQRLGRYRAYACPLQGKGATN